MGHEITEPLSTQSIQGLKIRMMTNAIINNAKRVAKSLIYRDYVSCFWSNCDNWGDALTPYLVARISGRPVRFDENPYCWKYFVIGSVLQRADKYSIVWGSGMISPEALPAQAPHRVHAVRGPLTRKMLMQSGIKCPDVYGDPALLLPRYFNPPKSCTYRLGVIPHMVDKNHPWIESSAKEEGVKVIDIEADIETFVKDVLSCECILSSSLHGLICADAYEIPNRRIVLSDQIQGADFKFLDYYGAANVAPQTPIKPKVSESALQIIPAIDRIAPLPDLDALLAVCPFKRA